MTMREGRGLTTMTTMQIDPNVEGPMSTADAARKRWALAEPKLYTCVVCGNQFLAKQPAKTCSGRCRSKAAYRRRVQV